MAKLERFAVLKAGRRAPKAAVSDEAQSQGLPVPLGLCSVFACSCRLATSLLDCKYK